MTSARIVPAQRPGEEAPSGRQVTARRQQNIDDLAMLIDSPVEIGPFTGDLQIGLIDLPIVARRWHKLSDAVAVVADLKNSTKLGTGK